MSEGGWGERNIEHAGHDGKGKERRGLCHLTCYSPIVPRALSIFRLLLFLLGYPAGASAEERGDLLTLLFCDVFILCGCL